MVVSHSLYAVCDGVLPGAFNQFHLKRGNIGCTKEPEGSILYVQLPILDRKVLGKAESQAHDHTALHLPGESLVVHTCPTSQAATPFSIFPCSSSMNLG